MTATDRLRELLDERGVEWSATSGSMGTIWTHWDTFNGCRVHAMDNGDGTVEIFGGWDLTPEQAIAATLGSRNCTNDCTNGERTETLTAERVMAIAGKHQPDYCSDTHVCFDWQAIADELNATLGEPPRLPYFWTHDGALHVELPKLPESISVRLPDQRDREVGSARVWQYTLGNDGVGRTNDGLADLQAENAKLRELVKALLTCATDGDCDECRLNGATPWHVGKAQLCDGVWDRVRELRVEVDE